MIEDTQDGGGWGDSSPLVSAPEAAPRRPVMPRLTLGVMMVLVAVVAADFSAMAALTRGEMPSAVLYLTTGALVFLYDLLLYFTLLALRKFYRPEAGARPSKGLMVATAAVLGVFVAVPVGVLAAMLLRS